MRRANDGVLTIDDIIALGNEGGFGDTPLLPGQVQPASLDLTLGSVAFQFKASTLPRHQSVGEMAAAVSVDKLDIAAGAVLQRGCIYLVPLREVMTLPRDVSGKANPKSSTGRLDVFVRVICDHSDEFDHVPAGYQGPLWAEIVPMTFPIRVRPGSRLCQIRFRRNSLVLADSVLESRLAEITSDAEPKLNGGLCLSLDLNQSQPGDGWPTARPRGSAVVGWRARHDGGIVDVDVDGGCLRDDFWDPVHAHNGRVTLLPDEFYILPSREDVAVPPDLAAEMVPYDAGIGEFRAHYAGFFDPGFGCGAPSRAVLEVRVRDVPFSIEHGQVIAKLVYERLTTRPSALYGQKINSHYQAQKLKLSKHFT